jgi:Zn-dependent M28 family amino/carboxypeptidase
LLLVALLLTPACTSRPSATPAAPSATPATTQTPPSTSPSPAEPLAFDEERAVATIRFLSEEIGPREATTDSYRRAARHVETAFSALGFRVRRQTLRVPAGVSWGVGVPSGETFNVIAEPAGFDPEVPHVVVGAHLDTVPQAPGANDNASGVAGVLELARLAAADPPPLPVVFIAFAAEEPRGSGDSRHHYGSRVYVARLDDNQREAVVGMISLDRIAYGSLVEVCTGGLGARTTQRAVLDRAAALNVRAQACDSRTSDHWSFEKAGMAGVRLGGARNPGYHSPADDMRQIRASSLRRVGLLTWETLKILR